MEFEDRGREALLVGALQEPLADKVKEEGVVVVELV